MLQSPAINNYTRVEWLPFCVMYRLASILAFNHKCPASAFNSRFNFAKKSSILFDV